MTTADRRPTRRFIAGAVCPQCRAVDRIVLEETPADAGGEPERRRRCVSCGYSDTLRPAAAGEPAARFSRHARSDAPASAVRIIDPSRRDR